MIEQHRPDSVADGCAARITAGNHVNTFLREHMVQKLVLCRFPCTVGTVKHEKFSPDFLRDGRDQILYIYHEHVRRKTRGVQSVGFMLK